jgi:hypothetical protein
VTGPRSLSMAGTDAALITIADRAESFFILLEGTNATSICELERKRFSKSAGHECVRMRSKWRPAALEGAAL